MTWLKGGSKGQNISKKRDITPSGSIAFEEEVTNAVAVIPVQRNGITNFTDMRKETEGLRTRSDRAHTPTSPAHSRVTSPTLRDASLLAIEAHPSSQPLKVTALKPYDDPEEYILKEDDLESGADGDRLPEKSTEVSAANGKKKGVKLRMAAFNILKMKSSSFLRKTQDGHEQQGVTRRRDSVDPFPSSLGGMTLRRSSTAAAAGTASASAPPRRRLQKPLPTDLLNRQRSTGVEPIREDSIDPIESRPQDWGQVIRRPSSSQSSHPGGATRGDDVAHDPSIVTGGNVPGGLYPRPPSLKRHWSDGPQGRRGSASLIGGPPGSLPRAATEGSDRPRPLSFLNHYGSMKITEAVTLESRVRDLESQVAMLKTYVTTHVPTTQLEHQPSRKSSHLSYKSSRLTDKSAQTSPALGPPFTEDLSLRKRPDTAQSDITTSTFMHEHDSEYSVAPESSTNGGPSKISGSMDWGTMRRGGPLTPNKTPYGDSSVCSYTSDETVNLRNRPYGPRNDAPGPSTDASKRSTVYSMDTITPHNHQGRSYDMDYHRERAVQTPVVPLTEYNGVLKQLKREYGARKRLEAQMQTLQEQMNHVLHRQLLQCDPIYNVGRSPTITARSLATTSAASTQRPDLLMNGRRASSEVPTPDLTPPRGRQDLARIGAHLFPNFDSNSSATDDMDDDSQCFSFGVDDEGSENWQTPAEDTRSLLIGSHLAPPLPLASQKRTMSISQITEKASLASARAAANR
ncbi:hypothetical protein L211DRAFT_850445 [Terfezia boudieri ATCC MYA-4762]|uniref:Uncharacterized protein n=1 Tax=Terfezia boudieri ATCC MYA-4762 TaxID=1051890 RepID=A0A3N4LIG3_9PEZI|nr:hypothetical protein L211DRAFT_850445 [Terfezia boudieri ATCC MYA-4762]